MRNLCLCLMASAVIATPAFSQIDPLQAARDAEQAAQAEAARRADVANANAQAVSSAQQQTDLALRNIQAIQQRPVMPEPFVDPTTKRVAPPPATYATIPDATLAASNAAARAAADNRH